MILSTAFSILLVTNSSSHELAPFFSIRNSASGRSHFVSPYQKPFWSFGVCCVDQGTKKEDYDPKNPSYRAYNLFSSPEAWAQDSVNKLRSFGFNTLGGWADYTTLAKLPQEQRMPYTVVLHLGAYYRAPWDDLFSAEALAAIDKAAKAQIEPIKDDPFLIGYFSDNELGWWDDTVFLNYVVKLPSGSAGRKRAHAMLRARYGSFANFKKDWITTNKSWDDFALKPNLVLRPGGTGMQSVNAWMSEIGSFYYQTVNRAIRKYDSKHLIMGDRYCQYYNIPLAKASAKWIDVCSTNLGADWTDGTLTHFYLDTLRKITGKPILITEFYMCANENRSGNKNSSAGFPTVQTQAERAKAFATNVRQLGNLPYIVGAHWFQYTDEPQHGRGDGENYNMGLLDNDGIPYEELTQASKDAQTHTFATRAPAPPTKASVIPKLAFDPMKSTSLKNWPRSSALIKPSKGDAFADLYVAQNAENFYVALYAIDYIDRSLYSGGIIPEAERSIWNFKIGTKTVSVRFGGDKGKGKPIPMTLKANGVAAIEKHDLKHTIILKIPKKQVQSASERISIRSSVTTHSRAESMSWDLSRAISLSWDGQEER